jgi:hypothetical protein
MTRTCQNYYISVALTNYIFKLYGKRGSQQAKGIFAVPSFPLIFLFATKATLFCSEVFQFCFVFFRICDHCHLSYRDIRFVQILVTACKIGVIIQKTSLNLHSENLRLQNVCMEYLFPLTHKIECFFVNYI